MHKYVGMNVCAYVCTLVYIVFSTHLTIFLSFHLFSPVYFPGINDREREGVIRGERGVVHFVAGTERRESRRTEVCRQ